MHVGPETASPVQHGTASPVQHGTASPVQHGTASPVQHGTAAPVRGTAAPVRGTAAPVRGTAAPVRGTAAPVHGTVDPLPKEWLAPSPRIVHFCNQPYPFFSIHSRPLEQVAADLPDYTGGRPPAASLPIQSHDFEHYMKPLVFHPRYAYRAFLPYTGHFTGELFAPLKDFSIVQRGIEKFSLEPQVIEAWSALEAVLADLGGILNSRSAVTMILSSPLPSFFGYQRTFKTAKSANWHASTSRKWFHMLAAELSYRIHANPFWYDELKRPPYSIPQTVLRSIRDDSDITSRTIARVGAFLLFREDEDDTRYRPILHAAVIPLWIRLDPFTVWCFRKSPVRYESLFPTDAQAREPIEDAAELPLALPRETTKTGTTKTGSEGTATRPEGVSSPRQAHHSDVMPRDADAQRAQPKYIERTGPPTSKYKSAQRVGETWQEFFARREEDNKTLASQETPEQKEKRLNRERIPPAVKATFFEWTYDENGFLTRHWLSKAMMSDGKLWDSYTPSQRRYDSWRNEWDLCDEFHISIDPNEIEEEDQDSLDHYYPSASIDARPDSPMQSVHSAETHEGIPRVMSPPSRSSWSAAPEVGDDAFVDDHTTLFLETKALSNPKEDVVNLLHRRFGFTCPLGELDPPLPVAQAKEIKNVARVIGMSSSFDGAGDSLITDAIVDFVENMAGPGAQGGTAVRVSQGIVRGSQEGSRGAAVRGSQAGSRGAAVRGSQAGSRGAAVRGSQAGSRGAAVRGSQKASRGGKSTIVCETNHNETRVLPKPDLWDLHPDSPRSLTTFHLPTSISNITSAGDIRNSETPLFLFSDPPYSALVLPRATDVMHVLRTCHLLTPLAAAPLLQSEGVTFRIATILPRPWHRRAPVDLREYRYIPFPVEIPFRPLGYKFTGEDYTEYELMVHRLLAQPHGRSARECGGIVWRIAASIIPDLDVLAGPSRSSTVYGKGQIVEDISFRGESYDLVFDMLSEAEQKVICGDHKCETGKNIFAQKSWWPLPTSWEAYSNGNNLGFWSDQNETWFQGRLAKIRAGEVGPLTITEWAESLRGSKPSSRLRAHVETESRKALTSMLAKGK